jgi:ATP-dependent DNA helicase RecG
LVKIQKAIRGLCRRLDPEYQPLQSVEVVEERHLLVLWVPAGDQRPYTAPRSRSGKEREYYIRLGAETVAARGALLHELMQAKARIPFDDRPAREFSLDDLRASLVREHLAQVRSGLLEEKDDRAIYRRLRLSFKLNGREVPRNVGLMFFSDDPEQAFPGARIELVQFAAEGDILEETVFRGPFDRQIRDCLTLLRNRIVRQVRKVADQPESETWESYPFAALEESIANAVYHRGYDGIPEPVKVYVYDDRIEVTSYPGPVAGLEPADLEEGAQMPQLPARNRRVGELLKELRLAETRGTGIRKIYSAMAANGSPPPRFRFDSDRTYFTVVLPAHPAAEAAAKQAERVTAAPGGEGLVLVSLGADSLAPSVEKQLPALGLEGAKVLADLASPGFIEAEPAELETQAKKLRAEIQPRLEEPGIERIHLFYRGPLAFAPLLGALVFRAGKPLHVYHYQDGRHRLAYVLDRRFLIG